MTREYAVPASPIVAAVLTGVAFIFTDLQLRRNTNALKAPVSQANAAIDNCPRTLSGYYSFNTGDDNYRILGASACRREVREIIPVQIQLAIRAGCSDERDATGFSSFMKTCTLDVEPALLRSTAQALRNDPEVAETLRYQYSDVYTATQNFRGTINLIEQTLAALGQPAKADGEGPPQ